ncbi:MAG: SBBP repeat-containing protein [Bacteroidia bacterium]
MTVPNLFSQNPYWDWANGTGAGSGKSIARDNSGNLYITGTFTSSTITFGSTILNNDSVGGGTSDIFIVKCNASGGVIWAKSVGGKLNDNGNGIAVDATGNIYVTGGFYSTSIMFGTNNLTHSGMFIAKYNPSGTVIWAKDAIGSSSGNGIALDAGGNAFIVGTYSSSSITFSSIVVTNSSNNNDVFIAKYDPSGTVQWAKGGGGSNMDAGNGITVDGSGNVIITGYFAGASATFGALTLNNISSFGGAAPDVFVIKYNGSTGNIVWGRSGGSLSIDSGNGVTCDGNGNVYLTGNAESNAVFGSINLAGGSFGAVFVVKYDANGNTKWGKSWYRNTTTNGYPPDAGASIEVDANKNTYITGSANGSITFGTTTINNPGIFVTKLDSTGSVVGVNASTSGTGTFGADLVLDPSENIFVTGGFDSSVKLDSISISNSNAKNILWGKICGNPPKLLISPTGPITLCNGDKTVLTATAITGTTYTWSTGSSAPSITVTTSGNYYATATNASGCVITTPSVAVTVNPPSSSFSYTVSNMTVHFTQTGTGCNTFVWDFGNGNTSTINPSPIVTYANAGIYSACLQCNGEPSACVTCQTINISTSGISEGVNNWNFSIYPNPGNGYIYVRSDLQISKIEVTNLIGESLYTEVPNHKLIYAIDVSSNPKGIYFMHLYTDDKKVTKKVIIE